MSKNKQSRIYNELLHEVTGIWYVSDEYGSKIMIKAPTTSIKALIKGCGFQLIFGKDTSSDPHIFHTGLKIFDDSMNFLIIMNTHRFLDEHLSLAKVWNLDKVQIQLMNELNVCVAFGDLLLKEYDRHQILSLIGNPKKLFTGPFDTILEKSLDIFQSSLSISPTSLKEFYIIEAERQVINLKSIRNFFYPGKGTVVETNLTGIEGEELEKEVFTVLYSLFSENIIKNPRIPYKSNTRELTDVLAFCEYGIFLVETKALSVMNTKVDRTMERKATGIKKQIGKATDQLVGAMKRVADGIPIYDNKGNEIRFNRKLIPHGIILVSEILPLGEEDETTRDILRAMIESSSMIHVIDLKEFMQFIVQAQGDKNRFDHFLVQRATYFAEKPALFMMAKFVN